MGWGICCGHGGGNGVGRGDGYGGEGAGARGNRGEGRQPDDNGRRHHFATARFAGQENAGNWAEYVAFGYGGPEILADLQPLREGPARSEQPEICAAEAVRGDVGNDERRRCPDLCAALAGGGRAGAGAAVEVCAGGEPGVAGKEGGDVFSVGQAAQYDHRSAIVFADSVGAFEGVGGKRYQRSDTRTAAARCTPKDRSQPRAWTWTFG